ncbi:hypothetical protein ANO11243_080710 [Dothideomycetidae sp. 11243]|nr:hypothetical protein ANO11243_080710 [fungal sp. No.11243]
MIVVEETHPGGLVNFGRFLVVLPILYACSIAVWKTALLLVFLRIFTLGYERVVTYVMLGIVLATSVAGTLVCLTECIPLNKLWNPSVPGTCVNLSAFYRYIGMPNIVSDVVMLLLPLRSIWKLNMPLRDKTGVLLTLLTGSLGLIVAVIRQVLFFTEDIREDGTWTSVRFSTWAFIEPGCYLITANLICLRPLNRYIAARCRGPANDDNSGSRNLGPHLQLHHMANKRTASAESGLDHVEAYQMEVQTECRQWEDCEALVSPIDYIRARA